ncbi:MAG: protease inhibitor I42 family protein [Planctomycetia bacterium]|nr:protease inhibitor I42 family protein [Planctomycetia bacterium]
MIKLFFALLIVGMMVGCDNCCGPKNEAPVEKALAAPVDKEAAPAEKAPEAAPAANPKERILTEKNSKQTIEIKSGDQIKIRLNANATTGYSWKMSLAEGNDKVVSLSEENYIVPKAQDPPLAGAPGVAEYTITAKAPGSATVSGVYYRPWEKPAPGDQRVEFQIKVQ